MSITTFLGWALFAGACWAYSQARPVAYKIDKMFGVVRPRGWDTETLALAGALATIALALAVGAVSIAAVAPRGVMASKPSAAWALVGASVVAVVYALVELS